MGPKVKIVMWWGEFFIFNQFLVATLIFLFSFSIKADCLPDKWIHGTITAFSDLYQYQNRYTKRQFFRFFLGELKEEQNAEQGIIFLYYLYHKDRELRSFYQTQAQKIYEVNLQAGKLGKFLGAKRKKEMSKEEILKICQEKLKLKK